LDLGPKLPDTFTEVLTETEVMAKVARNLELTHFPEILPKPIAAECEHKLPML
jgi:hypothetical protein